MRPSSKKVRNLRELEQSHGGRRITNVRQPPLGKLKQELLLYFLVNTDVIISSLNKNYIHIYNKLRVCLIAILTHEDKTTPIEHQHRLIKRQRVNK